MAMMGSSAWNGGQDGQMHQGHENDFHQFLDIGSMGELSEGLQFDFQDFQDFQNAAAAVASSNGAQLAQSREPMDTPMSGTEMPSLMSTTNSAAQQQPQQQQMRMVGLASTSAGPHASVGALAGIPVPSASMVPLRNPRAPPTPIDAISEIDAKIQYLQQQRIQQQQRQLEEQQAAFYAQQNAAMVPPTPQSLDIQAGNRFYVAPDHTPQQGMYERYQRLNDQDMSFTPLVSPAVTPLETQFPMDSQFTIPGAYFSPLASPALHAQTESSSMFEKVSGAANRSSPGEMDLETGPPTSAPAVPTPTDAPTKKTRKGAGTKARSKGNVRQSPISKPQRKKTATTPIMNAQALSELAESLEHQDPPTQHLLQPPAPQNGSGSSTVGATDSENGSVSPETLSEMPPPPVPTKPRSARPSPYIEPQNNASKTALGSIPTKLSSPATPASLMRLTSPSTNHAAMSGSQDSMPQEPIESFELPESVQFQQKRPVPPPLVTRSPAQSPSIDPKSGKASNFQPLPSPGLPKPAPALASTSQSPHIVAQTSSTAATPMTMMSTTPTSAKGRKTPQLAPRGSKKRASVSSVHVSPALRPRISPVIKPLLPGGASSAEDAASMLLTSKSNYQNILEGNSVPGVSYPSELSTNLTSKRTSHKIAEQGRRNRINSALQEIAALLPATVPEEGGGGGGGAEGGEDEGAAGAAAAVGSGAGGAGGGAEKGEKGGGDKDNKKNDKNSGPNSKASTVEMAIEYIKQLKKEVAEATRRAEEAEKKLQMKESETAAGGSSA